MSGTASPVARAVVQPVASSVVGDVGGGTNVNSVTANGAIVTANSVLVTAAGS